MTKKLIVPSMHFVKTVVLSLSLAGYAMADSSGAKALFMGQDDELKVVSTSPARPAGNAGKPSHVASFGVKRRPLAIMAWVKLVDDSGGMQDVSPNRLFKSGEKIRLSVKPNKDGYLYVVSLGTSGRANQLYPRKGQSNAVKAGQTYETPDRNIRFDNQPGAEEVMVVLSPVPLDRVKIAEVDVPVVSETGVSNAGAWQHFAMATGSKDLLVEDDPGGPGASPALYVAENPRSASAKGQGKPLSVNLKLKHE